jgi:post-segregation antitoxin (ccd killing protein)
MGRKRLPEEQKKVNIKLTVKTDFVKMLKEKDVNISKLFEEFVKNYLNK